jgi:hypothetical protein
MTLHSETLFSRLGHLNKCTSLQPGRALDKSPQGLSNSGWAMKLLLSVVIFAASIAAACGGGGSTTPPPPPPVGKFSNASLKGQYAYSMSGEDLNGAFIARVGSFSADGSGNITQGLEDVNSATVVTQVSFNGGTYSIQPNGRGTLALTNATSSLLLSVTLISPNKGFMIQTDLNATSSGNFSLQTPTAFTLAGVKGNYVFDFSGVNGTGAPTSIIGQVKADGAGNVTGGTADVSSGTTGNSGAQPVPATTYVIDPTNGATFGRGTSTINGISYVFYIVDVTRIKFMGVSIGALLGDAVLQTGTIPTQTNAFSGNFAFLIGGSSVLGTAGPLTRAGRFTADGSGNLNTIFLDDNNLGTRHSFTPSDNPTAATYAIDTTAAVVGSGRGTLTFTEPSFNPFSFVFYLVSPTQAVIQDTSSGVIADGTMLAQVKGPISISPTANFAFNWSGINLGSSNNIEFEEDFVGQYTPTAAASGFNGAMDFTELGSVNKNLFTNIPITVSISINGDGTGVNGYQVVTGNSPSTTFAYHAYLVDSNTILLIGFDSNHVIAGTVSIQP